MNHERVHPRLVLQNRCVQVLAVLDDVQLDLDFLELDDPLVLQKRLSKEDLWKVDKP